MYSGDIERSLPKLEAAVEKVTRAGAIPVVLGGDHSIAFPDAKGVANVLGHGRVSMIHFDAHADTGDIEFGSLWGHGQPMRRLIESGALRGDRFLQVGLRGYWPPPETLDWMAGQQMRSFEMTEIVAPRPAGVPDRGVRHRHRRVRGRLPLRRHRRLRPRPRAGHRHAGARWAVRPRAARLGAPDLPRAARRRRRRRRGQPALRPRRHHRGPGEPRRPRGTLGDRPPTPRRARGDPLGPLAAPARRPRPCWNPVSESIRLFSNPLPGSSCPC